MMLDWLGSKHNDVRCMQVGQRLEDAIFELVKSGVKTRDIGGDRTTLEFTTDIAGRL